MPAVAARLFERPVELDALEVPAEPHSLQIVAVPVPPQLASGGDFQYQIVPEGTARLVGPLTGTVSAGPDARPVIVTARLDQEASAGVQTVATVRFSQAGGVRGEIPVRLRVAGVHGATLRLGQTVLGGHPGERVSLRYFLTNTGNTTDTFALSAEAPVGWRLDGAPTVVVLGGGATGSGEVGLVVPRAAGAGALRLALDVALGGHNIAQAVATLEVVVTGYVTNSHDLQMTAGMASVLSSRSGAPVVGLDVLGPVAPGISATGRFVRATNDATVDPLSLNRVGYYVGGSYLTLQGSNWQATGGATGRTFSDVTGMNIYGQGVSASLDESKWTADFLGAAPSVGAQSSSGHLYGARVGMRVDSGWVGATVTDLHDSLFSSRQLQAVALGGVTPAFSGFTVAGELAHRSFDGGSGLGWSAELDQRSASTMVRVRALSAPGGTTAYARDLNEVSAIASQRLGTLEINGSAFVSHDANPSFASLQSVGWSLSPQLTVTNHLTLNADVRGNSYQAGGVAGQFGNDETSVRLGAAMHWGAVYTSGSVTAGQVSRSTAIPAAPKLVEAGGRYAVTGTAGISTDRGTFEASASYDQSSADVGYLPHEALLALRADNVGLWAGGDARLHADIEQYVWFGTLPSVTIVRVGVVTPLPGDLRLTVDVQHNPLITGVAGGTRWVPVVKLERSFGVGVEHVGPTFKGIVYEDRNGNGVRDRGEPGIPNVVVRRGDETAVTDASGNFRFFQQALGPARVDETSLPFGLVANPRGAVLTSTERAEIGIWPTTSVDVRLVPTADETGRLPRVDFRNAQVSASDSAGNTWNARVDSAGLVRFDALPPGTYHLGFDLKDVREPVNARSPFPVFTVMPGRPAPRITVPLYPRPVRLFDPTNQRGRGAARGQG